MLLSDDEIERRYSFHPANTESRKSAHEQIREVCKSLQYTLNHLLPAGREAALAATHLEEVMFWSNAAIARERQ